MANQEAIARKKTLNFIIDITPDDKINVDCDVNLSLLKKPELSIQTCRKFLCLSLWYAVALVITIFIMKKVFLFDYTNT
jgi:hypothetical protein